jgi:hypothetical protein
MENGYADAEDDDDDADEDEDKTKKSIIDDQKENNSRLDKDFLMEVII